MKPTEKEKKKGTSKHDKYTDGSKDRTTRYSKKDRYKDKSTREKLY